MQIVINIDKNVYERIKYLEPNRGSNNLLDILMCSVQDGTPFNEFLDKIRAEIIQMPTISCNANDIYKADVLAFIDKYKAKSEK